MKYSLTPTGRFERDGLVCRRLTLVRDWDGKKIKRDGRACRYGEGGEVWSRADRRLGGTLEQDRSDARASRARAAGHSHTFGIPGVHNTELYDATGRIGVDHAGAGHARGRRRFMATRSAAPARHRRAGDRARGRRDPRDERHRRGFPGRHPDDGDRRRHPPRPRPRVPAPRDGPARAARADHQGPLARRAACGRGAGDLRRVPARDHRKTGPVFVEIPVNLQLFPGDAGDMPDFTPAPVAGHRAGARISRARRNCSPPRSIPACSAAGARSMRATKCDPWPNASARRCRRRSRACRRSRRIIRCTRDSRWGRPRFRRRRTRSATATACSRSARASPRSRPAATAASRPRT